MREEGKKSKVDIDDNGDDDNSNEAGPRQSTVIMGEGNGATNLALKNSTTTLQIAQEMMIN